MNTNQERECGDRERCGLNSSHMIQEGGKLITSFFPISIPAKLKVLTHDCYKFIVIINVCRHGFNDHFNLDRILQCYDYHLLASYFLKTN